LAHSAVEPHEQHLPPFLAELLSKGRAGECPETQGTCRASEESSTGESMFKGGAEHGANLKRAMGTKSTGGGAGTFWRADVILSFAYRCRTFQAAGFRKVEDLL
jgi:hypothetical protein